MKEESSYKRRSAMPCNAETCGEGEDEKGVKEEESPAFNMMVLPNAELSACGWSFFFSCSHLNHCWMTSY